MTVKRLAAVLGVGLAGSQAGHLLAYELRFGGAAQQLQGAGAHAYFPALAKTGLGLAALALLAGMLVVGSARVLAGRRIEPGSAPSPWRLLSVLYTLQLACFAGQETAEAVLGGAQAGSAPLLLLWGAVGQLPVALVAALALRWLLSRFGPAVAALRLRPAPLGRLVAAAYRYRALPPAAAPALAGGTFAVAYVRGPPSF